MLADILRGDPTDDADPNAIDVTIGGDLPDEPDSEAIDLADIDDPGELIATFREFIDVSKDAIDRLEAEQERRQRDERLAPFDIPSTWDQDPDGDALRHTVVSLADYLANVGEATTAELYEQYRREAPSRKMSRVTFEANVATVLAGADGVDPRLWRLDADDAAPEEDVNEAARDVFPVLNNGSNVVGRDLLTAAYQSLADAPPWGRTRLGLVNDARRRANCTVPRSFAGPVDEYNPEDRERYQGLAALLDLPGVEPPADPAWRWVGGGD